MWQGLFINFKKYKHEGEKEYVVVGPFETREEVQRLIELGRIEKVWEIFQQLDGNRNKFCRMFGLKPPDRELEIETSDHLVEFFGNQLVESNETLGQIKRKSGEVIKIYHIPSI